MTMKEIIAGFRAFLFRGNIIELAVAFVIGVAFAAVINAFVTDLVTPIIAAIVGKSALTALTFHIGNARFYYGDFLNEVITFVVIAAAIYFLVVVPTNLMTARMRRGEGPAEATTKVCPECLSTIPLEARRCAYCTSALT
jgi:large conductance mechanosensitive channel